MDDVISLSAKHLVSLIKAKKISYKELMEAHLIHIARVNPTNGVATLRDDIG